MAKDGTNRGGVRAGAGAKESRWRIKLRTAIRESTRSPLWNSKCSGPARSGHAGAKRNALGGSKDGKGTARRRHLKSVWQWLSDRGCAHLVPPDTIERYAMSAPAGFSARRPSRNTVFSQKHPTTGNAIASPYVTMANNFKCQTRADWAEIFRS